MNVWLILGLFLIFLAKDPNQRDETVSASLYEHGDAVTIKAVFELPPSDSVNNLVSFEFQ